MVQLQPFAIGTKDCLKLYLWMLSGFALLIAWFCILDIGDASPLTAFCFALIRMLALSDGEEWSKWGSSCSEQILYCVSYWTSQLHQSIFSCSKEKYFYNLSILSIMWLCSTLIINRRIQKRTLFNIYVKNTYITACFFFSLIKNGPVCYNHGDIFLFGNLHIISYI